MMPYCNTAEDSERHVGNEVSYFIGTVYPTEQTVKLGIWQKSSDIKDPLRGSSSP